MLSPSDLTVEAAGLSLSGGMAATAPGRCAMCGKPHASGDKVQPFVFGTGFTDVPALADLGSRFTCLSCVAVWNENFMRTYSKSVICREGVFPAARNDHIAYWLLNPPKPPFIFILSDQKQQHLVWRAPVNLSNEVFAVRFGIKVLVIRRAKLQPAVDAARALALAASTVPNRRGAALKSPFVSLAREHDNTKHGVLRADVLACVATSPQLQAHVDYLAGCTDGEIWALTALLYAKEPQRSEPALFPTQALAA